MCAHTVMFDSLQTPWTVACQAPLPMEFSRHSGVGAVSYCRGSSQPEPASSASPAFAGRFVTSAPLENPKYALGLVNNCAHKLPTRVL